MKNRITTSNGISIGRNSETLINVLLGFNSKETVDLEFQKLSMVTEKNCNVRMVTDLSLYDSTKEYKIWKRVLENNSLIAGTVPIYLAKRESERVNKESLIETIQEQSEDGVHIITIHPTPTVDLLNSCQSRLIPMTSRGGGVVLRDMLKAKREQNIYMLIIDEIINIAKRNKTIISIGSSFRSGTIIDAFDKTYQDELQNQFEIAEYIEKRGVQVIIETPGHADPKSLKRIFEALNRMPYPIMPLGPMPTDIGEEQDDFIAAIGATLMGTNDCADILSVVTSAEHMGGVPSINSLMKAIKKYELVKHIIDLYKIDKNEKDYEISYKRSKNQSCINNGDKACDRCGEICPLQLNHISIN